MRKITKETIRRIKWGYHDDLMEAIEFLIDSYNEDKFDSGYKSCLEDLSVRSYKLAEYLHEKFDGRVIDTDETAKAIEEYYTRALKEE